mmetsp:Transcript_34353/g.75045  ORF Transcript_34353/g.75045 Transcript_34353/m.75045 type:complete len:150 (+) Transcript_34353:1-450(+)
MSNASWTDSEGQELAFRSMDFRSLDVRFSKTKLCKFHMAGLCRRGERCTYAHFQEQLVLNPDLRFSKPCNSFFFKGFCKWGNECTFLHSRRVRPSSSASSYQRPTIDTPLAEVSEGVTTYQDDLHRLLYMLSECEHASYTHVRGLTIRI